MNIYFLLFNEVLSLLPCLIYYFLLVLTTLLSRVPLKFLITFHLTLPILLCLYCLLLQMYILTLTTHFHLIVLILGCLWLLPPHLLDPLLLLLILNILHWGDAQGPIILLLTYKIMFVTYHQISSGLLILLLCLLLVNIMYLSQILILGQQLSLSGRMLWEESLSLWGLMGLTI